MSIQSKFLVTNITENMCSEKRYVKNLTACRGAHGSGQIMSLKESAGAFFCSPGSTVLAQNVMFVFLKYYSHLESCIDLVGETESALIRFILAPFLLVTRHLYYFFCLI